MSNELKKQITPINGNKNFNKISLPKELVSDLRELINNTRNEVAQSVNSALVILYWQIGQRIQQDILREERAEYGKEIIINLSRHLVKEFGNGYSPPNLSRMVRLAEAFPDLNILSTLSKKLSWSHFVEIIPLKDDLQRDFYAEMCRLERSPTFLIFWDLKILTARRILNRLFCRN